MSNRSLKGLAAVLVVVLTITALAVMPAMAEEEEIVPTPAERFLARVADHLDVSVEELESAITAARIEIIEEAVEAGRITREQADRITERLGEGGVSWGFCRRNFRRADLDRGALEERLEAAVEAGRITREQADRITERLGEGDGFGSRGLGRRSMRGGFGAWQGEQS